MKRNPKILDNTTMMLGLFVLAAGAASCGGEMVEFPATSPETSDTESSSDSHGSTDNETTSTDSEEDTSVVLVTTLLRIVQPVLEPKEQKASTRDQWGLTEQGPGEPFMLRDDLGALDVAAEQPAGEPSSLAFFWHITDSHVSDEESPARLILSDSTVEAAFRLQESWSSQILDATLRTGRALNEVTPFDFALLTGDLVDNIHGNELSWLMTVLDGGQVHPDSGKDDDPLPGPGNDPHDPFEAQGLGEIPWYFTLGNHDDLIAGNFSTLDWLVADPTGSSVSTLSRAVVPTCLDEPFFANESRQPQRCYVPGRSYYTGTKVVADGDREFIDRQSWVDALWSSTTAPSGHGLEDEAPVFDYAVDVPEPGGPLRLIVLDTVAQELANGAVTQAQLKWLEQELRKAENASQLVIVASHHPTGWLMANTEALEALLQTTPNVILHIHGHEHTNQIVAHRAPQGTGPEFGYFEVGTSSTIAWPQQTRLVEVVDNRDNTISIFGIMLDFEVPQDRPEVEGGRFYGLFDVQAGSGEQGQGNPRDRNVELRIAIPQDVADSLRSRPQRQVQTYRFAVAKE